MKPSLGTFVDGGSVQIDLPRLLETRLLAVANSGAGKSWLVRRLLEQTAGQVQQLVIDPDGEYATLREKYDYVIAAAHDGDAVAHPRTAALLARRLLETGVSAILDIYDLKAHERQTFVRLFLDALVNAPKTLWRPCLVVLDEAHVYCPETGSAEASGAVIDLATRGRKRGFALVAATQRLAKLNKDAAAELLNKLIGRTGLDVDVKRAADELGMTQREAVAELRGLEPGNFFAYGPALSPTVRKLEVGPVRTTHPKAGDRTLKAPPKPTAAIVAVLPKLADLPKEAEAEARTLEDLRKELANARRDLTVAKSAKPGPSREDLQAAESKGFERGLQEAQRALVARLKSVKNALHQAVEHAIAGAPLPQIASPVSARVVPAKAASAPRQVNASAPKTNGHADPRGDLSAAARKILGVLSQFPDGCVAGKLTLLTGYRYTGTFRNALSELRTAGFITGDNGSSMQITEAGRDQGPFPELPQGDDLVRYWLNQPNFSGAARKILGELQHGDELTSDELCQRTSYEYTGTFRNALSELRTAGVLVGKNTEAMRISREIVP